MPEIKACSNCYFSTELNNDDVVCYLDKDNPKVKSKINVCGSHQFADGERVLE